MAKKTGKSAIAGRYTTIPRSGSTKVLTKSGRMVSLDTQRAAARAYVKASEKAGEPVSARIRRLASEAS